MKNFLLKTKGNYSQSDKKLTILRYLVVICIAFLVLYGGKSILVNVSSFITTPVFMARHYFNESTATIPVFLRSRIQLDDEINSLKQKIAEQQGYTTTINYLTSENSELKNMLHASSSPRIVAGVVSEPPYTPYDTMIIDRGSKDGIIQNAPVYYESGQAIGYIKNIFERSAQVTLFSSPEIESTVYIFGPNIFTTAYGEGGGVIRISVPQGIKISKDNVVVLPSLDGGVLGTIDDIQSIPSEPEQRAYVVLDASLQSIRLVTVGTNPIIKPTFKEAEFNIRKIENTLFTVDIPADHFLTSSSTSSTTKNSMGSGTPQINSAH